VYGPSADYAAQPADGTPKRKRIAMLAVAIAAAVATTVGVLVATSGGDGSSFCSDYASLRGLENAADPSAGQKIAAMFRKLAAEGPPDAKADLTLLARDITAQVNGQSIDTAAEDAAVARADRIAERTCAHR
jgi:hypothetical protein